MKVIETPYHGVLFRSRTEARWAIFFDALGIKWIYEPEAYSLPSGNYLPDFFLPEHNLFVEIKGSTPTKEEEIKCSQLAKATSFEVLLCPGQPEETHDTDELPDDYPAKFFPHPEGSRDAPWLFGHCGYCGKLSVSYGVYHGRHCNCNSTGKKEVKHRGISKAVDASRSHRFWEA